MNQSIMFSYVCVQELCYLKKYVCGSLILFFQANFFKKIYQGYNILVSAGQPYNKIVTIKKIMFLKLEHF